MSSLEQRIDRATSYEYPDEPYGETIARLRDQIQYLNEIILEMRDEIQRLKALKTEHRHTSTACEHGLPHDCCKICAGARRVSDIAKHEEYLDAWESSRDAEV